MKDYIIKIANKTIYQIVATLGIVIPSTYLFFSKELTPIVLNWICGFYMLLMLVLFIVRTANKKSADIPSLIGMGVSLLIILLNSLGFI